MLQVTLKILLEIKQRKMEISIYYFTNCFRKSSSVSAGCSGCSRNRRSKTTINTFFSNLRLFTNKIRRSVTWESRPFEAILPVHCQTLSTVYVIRHPKRPPEKQKKKRLNLLNLCKFCVSGGQSF